MSRILEFKVVMIGAVAVGKTAIANRLQFQVFEEDYQPTVGAGYIPYKTKCSNEEVELQIWDTAGMEKYKSLGSIYYRDANAAVLVYDQTSQESADALESWLEIFRSSVKTKCVISVAANKDDLPDKNVNNEKVKEWASEQGFGFFITSAKTGKGVEEMFQSIVNNLLEKDTAKNDQRPQLRSTKKEKKCCK